MKNLLFAFTVIIFMFGCATLPKSYTPVGHDFTNSSSNLVCQDLYEDIAKKWGYHQSYKSCYYYNEKLISSITQKQDCFIGLSEIEIKQIFGEPSTINKNRLSYTVSKNCSGIDTLFASMSLRFKILNSEIKEVKFQEADVHN